MTLQAVERFKTVGAVGWRGAVSAGHSLGLGDQPTRRSQGRWQLAALSSTDRITNHWSQCNGHKPKHITNS